MGGYFPQQGWPWAQPQGWGQQQQFGGWGGMQGFGGGWPQQQQYAPMFGQQTIGQYQPSAGAAPQASTATAANGAPAESAAAPAGPDPRRARLNNRIDNLQQQWAAAGTQDQGAIRGQIHDTRQLMQRQRRNAAPAYDPNAAAAPGAMPGGATAINSEGTHGYTNYNAAAGQPVMSLGTQSYNTNFGNLVPTSGGNGNLFKVAGQGEGPGQTFAFQNGQWGQANNSEALAGQYTMPPSGAGSGQVMQDFYRLGQKPAGGYRY